MITMTLSAVIGLVCWLHGYRRGQVEGEHFALKNMVEFLSDAGIVKLEQWAAIKRRIEVGFN